MGHTIHLDHRVPDGVNTQVLGTKARLEEVLLQVARACGAIQALLAGVRQKTMRPDGYVLL